MANYAVKKIHKNMYPATYNFKDDADGTTDTDITGITLGPLGTDTGKVATIVALEDGHKKVVKFVSNGDNGANAYWRTDESSGNISGTYEIWFKYIDKGVGRYDIRIYSTAEDLCCQIRIDSVGNTLKVYYGDGLGGTSNTSTGVTADTWHHLQIEFNCTTDTQSVWLNGVNQITGENFMADVAVISLKMILYYFYNFAGANSMEFYIDAVGIKSDPNYNVGDNIHWRNYKESTDSFEGDAVGTQGTSITWVDAVDTAASTELVQEFNEHKKILRQYYSSAAGGYDHCTHNLASQAKAGWWEGWIKVSDITVEHRVYLLEDATAIIIFKIDNSKFQYYDSGGVQQDVSGAPTPVNNTWYYILFKWIDAATDNYEIWIDNVQYESAAECRNNQTSGINKVSLYTYGAAAYIYLDAPICSLDSDERADNRLLDYHDSYTREDITTEIINVTYSNLIYKWRRCSIYTTELFEKDLYIFQVYDINSKLSFEGEIKGKIQDGVLYRYPLRDKNWDELSNRSSNTFSSAKIHDPTVSGSMLKTVIPTVGQVDGDLILVNADTKTDIYSPVTKYYPDYMFLRDISDLADSCIIIEASGKVHLDDDLASGTALDVDTASDKDSMTDDPRIIDILETINYYEIFGAINPDTGVRFSKVIDNSGTDKKRKWRYTNNEFRTQTDVDNYAAKLAARVVSVKIITIFVQGIGIHDMGTTLDYKFVHSPINIPQANYYIIEERVNFDTSEHVIVLSEGMIEESKYSAGFERPQNYADSYAAEIYETDIITICPPIFPVASSGASYGDWGVLLNAKDEFCISFLRIDDKIDNSRDIEIIWTWRRGDANADTLSGTITIVGYAMSGAATHNVEVLTPVTLNACALSDYESYPYTMDNSDVLSNYIYRIHLELNEASRIISVGSVSISYYQKRVVL